MVHALLLVSLVLAQPIYTWVDESGETHFTDDPSSVPKGRKAKVMSTEDRAILRFEPPAEPPRPRAPVETSDLPRLDTETPLRGDVERRLRQGDLAGAMALVDRSRREQPKDSRGRAAALERIGHHTHALGVKLLTREGDERVETLCRLLGEVPRGPRKCAELHLHAASMLLQESRFEDAERRLRKAQAADASHPGIWSTLGTLRIRSNDPAGAVDAWTRGLRYDPKNAELKWLLERNAKEAANLGALSRTESDHFVLSFEGERQPELGKVTLELLEDAWAQVGTLFDLKPAGKLAVVVYPDQAFYGVRHTSWAAGFYDGKIRVPGDGALSHPLKFKSLLFHEYAHAVFDRAVKGRRAPAWLNEGMAQLAQVLVDGGPPMGCGMGHSARLASLPGAFGALSAGDAQAAYPTARHAVERLQVRFGRPALLRLLAEIAAGATFEPAFERAFSMPYGRFVREFDEQAEGH